MTSIEIGDTVADGITGYVGRVTAITAYIGGTRTLLVEAPAGNRDGQQQAPATAWIAECRIIPVEAETVGPGEEIRLLRDSVGNAADTIDRLQDLMDETICCCTLQKMCPKHSPDRPTK